MIDRKPVAAFPLGAIICVLCDDGSMWVAHPNGEQERSWVEGTPVPGTAWWGIWHMAHAAAGTPLL